MDGTERTHKLIDEFAELADRAQTFEDVLDSALDIGIGREEEPVKSIVDEFQRLLDLRQEIVDDLSSMISQVWELETHSKVCRAETTLQCEQRRESGIDFPDDNTPW